MAGMQIGDTEEPWAKPTVDVSPPKDRGMIENAARAAAEAPIPIPGGTFMPSNLPPTVASTTPLAATPPAPNVLQAVGRYLTSNTVPGQLAGEGGISRGYDAITANAPVATPATPSAPAATVGKVSSGEGGANRGYGDNFGPGLAVNAPSPVTSVPGPISSTGGMTGHGNDLVAIRADLAARRAAEDMGQQQKIQAMQANANWASAWGEKRDAQNAADMARFRATSGADMVLASGSSEYEGQRQAIRDAATQTNARLGIANADLQKAQAGLTGPPRNYIDEFGKLQTADKERMNAESLKTTAGARVTEANARATEAGAKSELERAQAIGITLNNDQHRKILDLSSKMFTGNPDEAAKAERSIRTLLGKNSDRYEIKPLGGGSVVNASGFPEVQPQTLAIVDKETGQAVEFKAGGGAAKGPPASADRIAELKKNDTPQMRAYFDQAYGAGAAARALGK